MFGFRSVQRREEKFLDAAQEGNLPIIRQCIDQGVDVKTKGLNGMSALHLATCNGQLETVKFLIERISTYGELKDNDGQTILHSACYFGHEQLVYYLQKQCHVPVDEKDNIGATALHYACQRGHTSIVKFLIQQCQANMEAVTNTGETVHAMAVLSNKEEVVQFLSSYEQIRKPSKEDSFGTSNSDLAGSSTSTNTSSSKNKERITGEGSSNAENLRTSNTSNEGTSMENLSRLAESSTFNASNNSNSGTNSSNSNSASIQSEAFLEPVVITEAMLNHPRVRVLRSAVWDNEVYSMAVARTAYGAAKILNANPCKEGKYTDEVILIAGGKGSRKRGVHTGVLNAVEMFDPHNCTKSQICSHRLNIARYSCGACQVTANIMCVFGGKGQRNEYLDSVELVSTSASILLPSNVFSLPLPMASFGAATIADKVYLFGGKTKDMTLDTVYSGDVKFFLEAYEGKQFSESHGNIWKKVATFSIQDKSYPRHSFSLVIDQDICWFVGGFDGVSLLNTVGIYSTKHRKFLLHPSRLAVARAGLSSFALGKNIVVFGGLASDAKSSFTNGQIQYNAKVNVSAEVLIRDDKSSQLKEVFVPVPNLDCPQKDQTVFMIGYRLYAMGQYNYLSGEPSSTISNLNLVHVRKAFQMDNIVNGVVAPQPFPMPVVPMVPPEPKMSPDFDKLKESINEWKLQIEAKTKEYSCNVHEAETNSQMLHDELVAEWKQTIAKTAENLIAADPSKENVRDEDVVKSKIDALRREFERQCQILNDALIERVQRRNKDYEIQRSNDEKHIQDVENTITEYGNRLAMHREQLETKMSEWINKKKKDVTNMESIIAGGASTRNFVNEIPSVDLGEDRKKIQRVYTGEDTEPATVSALYGRYCTNNYDVKNQIGIGGFGAVYRGNDISLRCTFAFKRVSMVADSEERLDGVLKSFQREISTLKRVKHPNIVALYGYYMKPRSDDSFLIYEFLDRGSLAGFLRTEDGRIRLPYLRRLRIMAESLRALNFLHTGGCIGLEIQHRDIKPHNICLAEDWSAKLIDCGLARIERIEQSDGDGSTTIFSSANGLAGTDGYVCRAYWNGMRPYLSACDIYSFGMVMIELIVGTLNRQNREYPGDFYNHFIATIGGVPIQNGVVKLMERCDEMVVWNEEDLPKLCNLALQCISIDVSKRPTAKALVYDISMMLLRGEIGELPESLSRMGTSNNAPNCNVCNEQRDQFIECRNNHILCSQCITQEAVVASNLGNEQVECPILECRCKFNIKNDLYAIVPQDLYDKTTAEGRILERLDRIERKANRVISEISLVRKGVNRGLQAMASLTTSGSSPCPSLVWIIPGASVRVSATNPRSWVTGLTEVPVKVYFLCQHSFRPISQPVLLKVKKKWLGHVAPALKVTLFVLRLATTTVGLPFPIVNVGNISEQVQIAAEFVDGLLEASQCSLINQAERLFTDGVQDFDSAQLKELTGRAYDLLADGVRTGGQSTWKNELKPVLNEHGATVWVKNEFVDRYL